MSIKIQWCIQSKLFDDSMFARNKSIWERRKKKSPNRIFEKSSLPSKSSDMIEYWFGAEDICEFSQMERVTSVYFYIDRSTQSFGKSFVQNKITKQPMVFVNFTIRQLIKHFMNAVSRLYWAIRWKFPYLDNRSTMDSVR